MKRIIAYAIMIIVAFLLQTTVFTWINFGGTVPNLMLLISVSMAMIRPGATGFVIGFFGGLLMDIMYGNIIGIYALMFLLITYFISKFYETFYREDITFPIILIAVADLLYGILMFLLQFVTRHETSFFFYLRRIILPEIIYTVIIGIFTYKLLSILSNKINEKGSDNLIV